MCIKKEKNKIALFVTLVFLGVFALSVHTLHAATLKLTSSSPRIFVGDTATVWVVVHTEGVAINNAEATIQYPSDIVEVVSVSRGSSIFSLWVEEPTFSNSTGVISFNGGISTPGYTGSSGNILSITVRAKKVGQANFSYSGAAVRANDGLGTNVLTGRSGIVLSVVPKEQKTEDPIQKEEVINRTTLKISSPTHPNQEVWYKEKNAVFRWTLPSDVDAIQTAIDNNDSGSPRVVYRPPIQTKEIEMVSDGVWYFKIRAQKDSSWGPVSTYLARIDATPPEKKSVDFAYDETFGTLSIFADIQDKTSGVDYYEISINDELVKTVPAKEFVDGVYRMNVASPGNNSIALKAFDRAGNSVEATGSFRSKGLPGLKLEPIPPRVSIGEQVLVKGTTKLTNADVVVHVQHEDGENLQLKTKSNSEGVFFVFVHTRKAGMYDIWARAGLENQGVSSEHLFTKASYEFMFILGPYSISGISLVIVIILLLAILITFSYYRGHRKAKSRPKRTIKDLHKQDHAKALDLLKKRLERHLYIIQNTRQKRLLTIDEKRIKEDIENDLDEIDRELREYTEER